MSVSSNEATESIFHKINREHLKYEKELNKGSGSLLQARKSIRLKIKKLTSHLERLIKKRNYRIISVYYAQTRLVLSGFFAALYKSFFFAFISSNSSSFIAVRNR
jgi:hypothetical protein